MSAIIPSWAIAGAKIVCVSPNPAWKSVDLAELGVRVPAPGEVYTIRQIMIGDYPIVVLAEIVNPIMRVEAMGWAVCEPGFLLSRFSPLITIGDDIASHFAHLLDARLRLTEEA